MFKFLRWLFGRKPTIKLVNEFPTLDSCLPEDFDTPCYLIGFVKDRGHRVLQIDYNQTRDI